MRISDCSSDVCSSDLRAIVGRRHHRPGADPRRAGTGLYHNAERPGQGPRVRRVQDVMTMLQSLLIANRGEIACRIIRTRSEEHTSELQSLMRISYAVFCLKKKNQINNQ